MKKSQINEILVDQVNRKNTILAFVFSIVILIILSVSFILLNINGNKNYTVSYSENSDIDYKVFLKENPYFKNNYLKDGNQYLDVLIDYIDANFNYNISLAEKDVDFDYTYRIDANVLVKTVKGQNPIYTFSDTLLDEVSNSSFNRSTVNINHNLTIDYNYYNDLIKEFVNTYGLENIESTLTVSMYVDVMGSCDEFSEDTNNESIISLVIPLTTKTVDIDIENDTINNRDNVMLCKKSSSYTLVFAILFVISCGLMLVVIVKMVKYIIDTRSPEDVYNNELAKILNNYGTYIQEVTDGVDLTEYEVWKIKTFTDMMEISDRLNQPILMVENNRKNGVYFVIPNDDKRLYLYGFKVSEIKQQMKKNYMEKVKQEEIKDSKKESK